MSYWSPPLSWLDHIGEALFVARVALLAAVVPLLLRLPLQHVRTLLEPRRVPLRVDPIRQQRILHLVDVALQRGRPLVRTSCLTRGVTRYYFLRRIGVDVALVFGVGEPTRHAVAGHCWLVKDGEPFLEARDPRPLFTEMFRIAAC